MNGPRIRPTRKEIRDVRQALGSLLPTAQSEWRDDLPAQLDLDYARVPANQVAVDRDSEPYDSDFKRRRVPCGPLSHSAGLSDYALTRDSLTRRDKNPGTQRSSPLVLDTFRSPRRLK